MGELENEDGDTAHPSFLAVNRTTMANDGEESARGSSNTRSREPSRALTVDDNVASGRATRKSSLSRLASPNPSTSGRTPNPDESVPSEAVTRRASTSSQMSSKHTPIPSYGTRSRKRPGAARINYAEDVEMDFEPQESGQIRYRDSSLTPIDDFPKQEHHDEQKRVVGVTATAPSPNEWSALNKNGTSNNNEGGGSVSGTSITANNTSTLPRKRKAAAVATQNMTATAQPAAAATTNGKRNGANLVKHPQERETNMVSFEKCQNRLNKDGNLVSDDGVVFAPNDHVYLICEPPGDPYYLGRIMEFRCKDPEDLTTQVEYVRINWAYRPRDVQRFVNDSRLVYVTMHSDLCPLTSLRGKCQLRHRAEIGDLDEYRKIPDAFWFNQCFDRFIHRWYEVIPASQVVNVPQNVKKALDERWKYIVVEASRVKELTSAVKSCTRCSGYCAADDSVDCALCKKTYHLQCVRPPLLKKPSRGFAWACAVCSRDQERKLEARRTPNVGDAATDVEEEEVIDEEEPPADDESTNGSKTGNAEKEASEAEIAHAKMWPMRYLGIHCRVEDVLQYEDRAIYPRASSRLGPKHQAITSDWYGRPVQLVKPAEIKRKYIKSGTGKKDTKLTKETQLAIEADRAAKANRPKYIQDEPQGYVARGEDIPNEDPNCTAMLTFRLPPVGEHSSRGEDDSANLPSEDVTDAYMERAKLVAREIGVEPWSTDFLDRAVALLQQNSFNADAAIKQLKKTKAVGEWPKHRWGWAARKDLRDPSQSLSEEEKKKFADGVRRYGSELRLVRQHVRTISHADTVRYWYYWKKLPQGRKIWGSFEGRKNASKKKAASAEAATKLLDDVADDVDDSAFDNQKIYNLTRRMQCKFCNTRHSRFWRRAPNTAPGETVLGDQRSKEKHTAFMVSLCQRCARLWRKYAIRWEDQDETAKKISQGGGKAWKRRVDEELVKEWAIAQETAHLPPIEPEDMPGVIPQNGEPPRKKIKGAEPVVNQPGPIAKPKPVVPPPPPPPPKEPTPPPMPTPPKMRTFPCAVCDLLEPSSPSDPLLVCRDCKLTVHKDCYGVGEVRNALKWSCDPCANDRREFAPIQADPAAYHYECSLCPIKVSEVSMIEPPRVSHKRKNERDREKERLEKELADKLTSDYRQHQLDRGRPIYPREALKRTADKKWVHVTCALWTPEIKFSNAKSLEVAEGLPLIPRSRREQVCKLCKTSNGACVLCHHCHASFHVSCAYKHNYIFGFDVTPVKSSRRDGVTIVTLGEESGTMTAAIWCKEHSLSSIKSIVHYATEPVDEAGKIALQLFAENYKQADLTLTGTARKANYLDEITKSNSPAPPVAATNRRISTATAGGGRSARNSLAGLVKEQDTQDGDVRMASPESMLPEKRCVICNIDVSPRWWKHEPENPVQGPSQDIPRDIQPTAEYARPNGLAINGVDRDITPKDPSRMEVDGPQLSNGHGPSIASLINGAATAQSNGHVDNKHVDKKNVRNGYVECEESIRYECNKCHWKRLNAPEELKKPSKELEPQPLPVTEALQAAQHVQSPPRPPEHIYGAPPPIYPPQHPGWLSYGNGTARSPPTSLHAPPAPTAYQVLAPPPAYMVPLINHGPYAQPPPGQPPVTHALPSHPHPPGPAPLHIIQATGPNGLTSPHGPPPVRSPTHPPVPVGPPSHRQGESPFTGPPPAAYMPGPYGHGSPRPPSAAPPPVAPRPSTPREPQPATATPRLTPHDASASPNLRHILNH